MLMNVLFNLFNPHVDQASPTRVDKVRVVKYDSKGEEVVSYEDFDAKKYQESLGPVDNWSLENLLKAGIDPKFPIHTGSNSRLDNETFVMGVSSGIDDSMLEKPENIQE